MFITIFLLSALLLVAADPPVDTVTTTLTETITTSPMPPFTSATSDTNSISTETLTYTTTETRSQVVKLYQATATRTKSSTATVTKTLHVSASPSPSPCPLLRRNGTLSIWSAPKQMADLHCFNITKFPGPKENLQFITVENQTVFQVFYPAHSTHPSAKPVGGSQFYASPTPKISSLNVTNALLGYSVYFPSDFDFVKGGKLPGLYGGQTSCSGGKDASTFGCFSTRLMWRSQGDGELYLYAPRRSYQDPSLCNGPTEECNDSYGYSIGRGTFRFAKGRWTDVKQQVILNTPGLQDGRFRLWVNGQTVIDKGRLVYRLDPSNMTGQDEGGGNIQSQSQDQAPSATSSAAAPTNTRSTSGAGGDDVSDSDSGLGGLGFITGMIHFELQEPMDVDAARTRPSSASRASTSTTTTPIPSSTSPSPSPPPPPPPPAQRAEADPIIFSGIFFSTFFGGHSSDWASPRDQYVWFKDFEVSYEELAAKTS